MRELVGNFVGDFVDAGQDLSAFVAVTPPRSASKVASHPMPITPINRLLEHRRLLFAHRLRNRAAGVEVAA